MGTMISLALGRLEVDWGKNNFFSNHGALFQNSDIKPVASYYANEDWPDGDPIVEMNEGMSKPLGEVRNRLELLGHTLRTVEHHYEKLHQFHGISERPIPFSQLQKALAHVDVNRVSGNYGTDFEPGEFVRKEILERLSLTSEAHYYRDGELRPDHWEIDLLLENFGASSALRLLAENEDNHNLEVSWGFTPLIESGWATREQFQAGASSDQQFLIVTEGSSDARIIEHAFHRFRPHIADFFRFVDMEEGYPFSGTGNLHRFAQGLVSIGIQNNILIVYDNDAEGASKLRATQSLSLPSNFRAIKLPTLEAFETFNTIGPSGPTIENINGKAAAIECYLDLDADGLPDPVVRWTSYNRELGVYHGELEHKTQFMKRFLQLRSAKKSYNHERIETVLDAIVAECVCIAEQKQISSLEP